MFLINPRWVFVSLKRLNPKVKIQLNKDSKIYRSVIQFNQERVEAY